MWIVLGILPSLLLLSNFLDFVDFVIWVGEECMDGDDV